MFLGLITGFTLSITKPDLTAYYQEVERIKNEARQQVGPTQTPTNIPIPKPSPTPKPSPVLKSSPTSKPTVTPTPIQNTADVKTYIMGEINKYRLTQGLSEVKTDKYTCEFAATRAKEVASNFSHDGFQSRIDNKTLPYPSYHYITENIAMNSNYKNVVQAWINSSGHAKNMRADTPFVCVEKYGNYYAYEGWRN